MKCIIGLGNPEKKYDNTRHNLGVMALMYIAEKYNIKLDKKKKKCIYGEGLIEGQKVSLIFPTTYMNLSGEAVVEMKNWYKVENEEILVLVDDIDLPIGTIRYRETGSGGTHNGLKNIVTLLGSENFNRIRIGIENRGDTHIDIMDYVLTKFKNDELETLKDSVFPKVEETLKLFLDK